MAKILKVNETTVSIGGEDGKIYKISKDNLDWTPQVGQEVEMFMSDDDMMIIPKKEDRAQTPVLNNEKGISINIQNQNNPISPNMNNNGSLKLVNKVVYILLALFLGGIGIHKFYAGKSGAGILYVIFCWTFIPCILAFIEAIVAAFQHSDRAGRIYV